MEMVQAGIELHRKCVRSTHQPMVVIVTKDYSSDRGLRYDRNDELTIQLSSADMSLTKFLEL